MAGKPRSGSTDRHVYCFVPSEELEIVVLAAYLQSFIDASATIKPSRHPRDRDRLGFTVGASSTLGREALEDLIQDSKDWEKEQRCREFEHRPYDYQDSDTWQLRKRNGPTGRGVQRRTLVPEQQPGRSAHRKENRPFSMSRSTRLKSMGSSRVDRKGDDLWWPARVKVRTPGPSVLASLMAANAVTVTADQVTMDDGTSVLWPAGNATVWHGSPGYLERLPPEAYLLGYATTGVLLVCMARRTPQHQYQDPVFFGSLALVVLAVISSVYMGSTLPSSLCKVLPVALLCGQLVNMFIAKTLCPSREVEGEQGEGMLDEKK